MMPKVGVEPTRELIPLRPERSASAYFATSAQFERDFTNSGLEVKHSPFIPGP